MSDALAQALVGALVLGSLYTVVGIGFVILYKATHVLNFAQGSLMLLGGLIFFTINQSMGVPWPFAMVLSLLAMSVIGSALYLVFFRRLVGAKEFTLVIATLGLSVVLLTVALIVWGPGTRTMPELLSRQTLVSFGNLKFSSIDVFSIATALVVVFVLDLSLRHTRIGIKMRAVADEPLLASLMKVNVNRMSAIAWGIAAFCAGVAGIAYSMRLSIDPVGLTGLGLLAFPAVLLGGLDSVRGVLVGGFLLAIVQSAATYIFGGIWADVSAYAVLLVVLLVRPRGFFGSRTAVRL
ncbi:branched-chain amino acid ABC transporter permease [Jatrophihabitans sp. GAS493]|uniref:branched-chain amino acid ABC transporter permease n=1 Tax=Jatrophihabitans sp. GAS493 TaxID=1907575 RepID=UPI0012FDF88F|nr:branched-chain amino acid ABC transporter permease [Jatrophihabitans sp. GAS493]